MPANDRLKFKWRTLFHTDAAAVKTSTQPRRRLAQETHLNQNTTQPQWYTFSWYRMTEDLSSDLHSQLRMACFSVIFVLWRCCLGVRKSIRPVNNSVMGYWHGYLSRVWCKWFAYGPADATATPSSLVSVKSRMVYLSGAGLPRLSWKKGS